MNPTLEARQNFENSLVHAFREEHPADFVRVYESAMSEYLRHGAAAEQHVNELLEFWKANYVQPERRVQPKQPIRTGVTRTDPSSTPAETDRLTNAFFNCTSRRVEIGLTDVTEDLCICSHHKRSHDGGLFCREPGCSCTCFRR